MGLFRRLFPGAAKPVAIPVHPHRKSVTLPKGQAPAVGGKTFALPGTGKPVAIPVGKKPVAERADIYLPRGEAPTGRRTDKRVESYGLEDSFIAGTRTIVLSSWLHAVEYHRQAEDFEVWFLDGAHVTVHGVSEAEARDFFHAPSKGGWYWDNVLGPGYRLGNPAQARKRWS